MAQGVVTLDQLKEVVEAYLEFDEFAFDIESMPGSAHFEDKEARLDPHTNKVFWISLAGPGRADAIPMGHPVGELIEHDVDDEVFRHNPSTGKLEEHRINPDSGRLKWFRVPEEFTPSPQQLWRTEVFEALEPLFFSARRKVNHTLKFDLKSIAKYYGGRIPPGPYADVRVAARLINENHLSGYRLGDMVKRHFKFEYDKSVGKAVETYAYSTAHLYSYLDAKYAWLLWRELQPMMKKERIRHIFDLEMDLYPAIMDMEMAGIAVDSSILKLLDEEFSLRMAELQLKIEDVYGKPINLNAPLQVGDLVYNVLGKRCFSFTKTNQPQVNRAALEHHERNPTVRAVLEHSQLKKLHGSFVTSLQAKTTEEGRVHGGFDQVGTVHGRFSSSSPNLQQIPSRSDQGKRIRELFIAGPGNVLIVSDYSQIELRVLAHFSRDKRLRDVYREGISLHKQNAELAFGKDYTAEQYSWAKNAGFSAVYGGSATTMATKYHVPLRIAEQILESFYGTYRRVNPWKEEVWDQARRRYKRGLTLPYIETIFGRRRRLPELIVPGRDKESRRIRASAERQAISCTVSGSAADLFKVGQMNCYNNLQEVSWEGHILMIVHDELVVEVPEKYADEGLELVKTSMENPINPFTGEPILSIPVEVEAKIVQRWSDGK